MVQCFLGSRRVLQRVGPLAIVVAALLAPAWAGKKKAAPAEPPPADLVLEGGRKLAFERAFSSEKELRDKPGFWKRVLDVVAGEPDYRFMVRPYSIAVDSRGRIIITDPGAHGVHIFDFADHKYKFIQRWEKDKDPMLSPQCVAVDSADNIYVTDSEAGKIFVFEPGGKFRRSFGSLKGGEGFFKRPTGIAIDSAAQRVYVTDTLRDKIFMLDMQGQVLRTIGHHGTGNGEFYFPTELKLAGNELVVVDAMNFRVQRLTTDGSFISTVSQIGDAPGQIFRPKGISIDSEGHLYIVDGLWGVVQVFDREGQLLYYFGTVGKNLGEFELPAGMFIDRNDRIFVVDSSNRRVQVFRYYGITEKATGAAR